LGTFAPYHQLAANQPRPIAAEDGSPPGILAAEDGSRGRGPPPPPTRKILLDFLKLQA